MANVTNRQDRSVTRRTFTTGYRVVTSGTVAGYNVDPVNSGTFFSPSLVDMGNMYQESRCVSIKIRFFPNPVICLETGTGNIQTSFAIGYTPVSSAVPPSTFNEIVNLSDSAVFTTGCTSPLTFTLGRKQLVSPMLVKWLHNDATPTSDISTQGTLRFIAQGSMSSSWVIQLVVSSTWEFRSPVPYGLYADRIAREVEQRIRGEAKHTSVSQSALDESDTKQAVEDEDSGTDCGSTVYVQEEVSAQPPATSGRTGLISAKKAALRPVSGDPASQGSLQLVARAKALRPP